MAALSRCWPEWCCMKANRRGQSIRAGTHATHRPIDHVNHVPRLILEYVRDLSLAEGAAIVLLPAAGWKETRSGQAQPPISGPAKRGSPIPRR